MYVFFRILSLSLTKINVFAALKKSWSLLVFVCLSVCASVLCVNLRYLPFCPSELLSLFVYKFRYCDLCLTLPYCERSFYDKARLSVWFVVFYHMSPPFLDIYVWKKSWQRRRHLRRHAPLSGRLRSGRTSCPNVTVLVALRYLFCSSLLTVIDLLIFLLLTSSSLSSVLCCVVPVLTSRCKAFLTPCTRTPDVDLHCCWSNRINRPCTAHQLKVWRRSCLPRVAIDLYRLILSILASISSHPLYVIVVL